jgi:hypothetical protein
MFAIPNGGLRDKRNAVNLKREGVKAGVPDIFLPVPSGSYHGLFVEMKWSKNKPSESQLEFIESATGQGYKCVIAYSAEEALSEIDKYLGVS